MTPGQKRALGELNRLQVVAPNEFTIVDTPGLVGKNLVAYISLRLGPMEHKEGGLELREREDFVLVIPPDFPFHIPWIKVEHTRFAGFPHVVWSRQLCLYQSKIEWNPSDGLYGFFDRLIIWLRLAAINEMDPAGGPLEPPHHVTDFSQVPFVIRQNAPVEVGKSWFGLAELVKFSNRVELVGWDDLSGEGSKDRDLAHAIFLEKPLPMEFPEKGEDFFRELAKQGIEPKQIIRGLALASLFAKQGDPIHFVLGIPMMRRAPNGSPKHHIAVWTTESLFWEILRGTLPKDSDPQSMRDVREEVSEKIFDILKDQTIKWCNVLEDREEILIRRDKNSLMEWFAGKKVLILGCGGLGSWAAEIVARARPNSIHLVDNGIVKPGLLARQNYTQEDIGSNKAKKLESRLQSIVVPGVSVQGFDNEAHSFIFEDLARFSKYDVVLDCTASHIFQMKLERDWESLKSINPYIISLIIDTKAQHGLSIALGQKSLGGIWDSYVRLKYKLCLDGGRADIVSAFYSEEATSGLFQPEPGCSDPTFSGSTADVLNLISTSLNLAISQIVSCQTPIGIAFSLHKHHSSGRLTVINLPKTEEIKVGQYRVRVSASLYREAKAWVKQNNRLRTSDHETGGLIWGHWDDAINVIWAFDLSGPPKDSKHDPGHFLCGIDGTIEEHKSRFKQSQGICGFIGHWHTHPDMSSRQSTIDLTSMAQLVSGTGYNQKRVMMLIFGRTRGQSSAGIYIYESQSLSHEKELVSIGEAQVALGVAVV